MLTLFVAGCKYKKGDMYTTSWHNDSLTYIILDKGKGENIVSKAFKLKLQHETKENDCRIEFVSDSATLCTGKGVLLFNTVLPDIENDMLTKGYFGTFTTRQHVIYLLVSYTDFERLFRKKERVGKKQQY
jgi:hypothetical protein